VKRSAPTTFKTGLSLDLKQAGTHSWAKNESEVGFAGP
jgi:hypothetical protein